MKRNYTTAEAGGKTYCEVVDLARSLVAMGCGGKVKKSAGGLTGMENAAVVASWKSVF